MAQTKHAILIGSTEFPQSSSELAPLPSAARDVSDLQSVLTDPELTQFDNVQVALDLPHWEVMRRINEVMRKAARGPDLRVLLRPRPARQ